MGPKTPDGRASSGRATMSTRELQSGALSVRARVAAPARRASRSTSPAHDEAADHPVPTSSSREPVRRRRVQKEAVAPSVRTEQRRLRRQPPGQSTAQGVRRSESPAAPSTSSSWPTSPELSDAYASGPESAGPSDGEAPSSPSRQPRLADSLSPPYRDGSTPSRASNYQDEETEARAPLAVRPHALDYDGGEGPDADVSREAVDRTPERPGRSHAVPAADGGGGSDVHGRDGGPSARSGATLVPPFGLGPQLRRSYDPRRATIERMFSRGERAVPATVCPPPLAEPISAARLFPGGSAAPPNVAMLRAHLMRRGVVDSAHAVRIFVRASVAFDKEPTLLKLPGRSPWTSDDAVATGDVVVVGDIHGQFFDLVKILHMASAEAKERAASRAARARRQRGAANDEDSPAPTVRPPTFLFLGDYVDRGAFGCEVLLLLAAMKLENPDRVFLLRGNHESRMTTKSFTFHTECLKKWGPEAYDAACHLFDMLPLAAVVGGRFFCVHGGLSPKIVDVEDINLINRRTEVPNDGAFADLLWADPTRNFDSFDPSTAANAEYEAPEFTENEERGVSYLFNFGAVQTFLGSNPGLISVIRAHECQDDGFTLHRAALVGPDPARVTQRRDARAARQEAAASARLARTASSTGVNRRYKRTASGATTPRTAGAAAATSGGGVATPQRGPTGASAVGGTQRGPMISSMTSTNTATLQRSLTSTTTSPAAAGRAPPPSSSAAASRGAGAQQQAPFPRTAFPALISVFSAPNYCGSNNQGAFLTLADVPVAADAAPPIPRDVDPDVREHLLAQRREAAMRLPTPRLDVTQFYSSPHPYELPMGMNGFDWCHPFMVDKLRVLLDDLLALSSDSDDEEDHDTAAPGRH